VIEVDHKIINTTVGRVLFNESLPGDMPFINGLLKKKALQQTVQYCYLHMGLQRSVEMLDSLKAVGFTYATRSGCRLASTTSSFPRRSPAWWVTRTPRSSRSTSSTRKGPSPRASATTR